MTLEQFEIKFKKSKRFNKYFYNGFCLAMGSFSLFMLYSLATGTNINFSGNKTVPYVALIFIFFLVMYGLFDLRNHNKLFYWRNDLSKDQNVEILEWVCSDLAKTIVRKEDNYAHFLYWKNAWSIRFEAYLFADSNLIAINVEGLGAGGFLDFGASKRTQNRILKTIQEKVNS